MLALIAAGAAVVLWRPNWLGNVAGLLLVGALVANCATVFNFPILIELLDLEQEQRQNMVSVLSTKSEAPSLAQKRNGRIQAAGVSGQVSAAPGKDEEFGGLSRGWVYLQYAPFLVILAAVGVLLGTTGSLLRRLAHLAGWCGVGVVLAIGVCWQRMHAEFHWHQAKLAEARSDYASASRSLATAIAIFPDFSRMQRTWLLSGRLDYRQGRSTSHEQFFLAYQHSRNREWRPALAAVDNLYTGTIDENPAVRHLAARLDVGMGLHFYRNGQLAAAEDLWQRASRLGPGQRDAGLLLGQAQARIDLGQPERVLASIAPVLGAVLADQPLGADTLVIMANAYFMAGQMQQARRHYAESLDLFTLPRVANYRAAKGLGGF
jgi:tetratricopeptide (TPR) repeat protein